MMAKGITWVILSLLAFCFIFSVNSKKAGAELRNAEERIPWKIFMKDESRRQDSNEKSLRAMHLCMEEEDRKELLITCDRRYSSKFACVGALEGNVQKCDRFKEKQVAVPICVQVESSYVSICEYKNLTSLYLCSPRNLNTQVSNYKEYRNSGKFSTGLHEDIRVCEDKQRRICLENGTLLPCSDIGFFYSKISENEEKFGIYNSTLQNLENFMTYKSIKSESDNLRFREGIQNVALHTSIIPKNETNNHASKYTTINMVSPRTGVTKFFNPREKLPFEFDKNEKKSNAGETGLRVQSDIPVVAYSLAAERGKVHVNSKLKSKTLNVESDSYESIFSLESSTDLTKLKSIELKSLFHSTELDAPYLISDRGKINSNLKYKGTVLSPPRDDSKFSTFDKNIYNFESRINETESISDERESLHFSNMENSQYFKSLASKKEKNNRKLDYETVNNLPPKRRILDVPNLQESLEAFKISGTETGYISKKIKLYEEEKEPSFYEIDFDVDEAVHNIKEHEIVIDNSGKPIVRSTNQLEKKYKRAVSTKEESKEARPRDSASMKTEHESRKLRNTKQPDKRPVVPVRTLKKSKREPAHAYGALYRASPKKKPVEKTTEQSSVTRSFFYILKCKDCDINNVMSIDENVEDINPKVEILRFKT